MAKWLNHAAIAVPRAGAGVFTHTVNPNSGTVVAGAAFTPTAGRFLLVVIEGAVTTYGTTPGVPPTGWTQEAAAVSSTGLYTWTRTAAGGDTLTVTHNGADYPAMFHWFEFSTGTTWVGDVTATSVSATGANPNLTGLTGTNLVMAAKANSVANINVRSATWNAPNVEILDYYEADAATDGYFLGICYQEDYASAS